MSLYAIDTRQKTSKIETTSNPRKDDVIYTFPESSGLDDYEGLDTSVRHVYT